MDKPMLQNPPKLTSQFSHEVESYIDQVNY